MPKAVFLDRDGTINEDVNYLKSPGEIKIFDKTKEALRRFIDLGFLNIIITNQSGIARGYFSEEDLQKINKEFLKQLTDDKGILIEDIFYCPYHTEGVIERYKIQSEDRKPQTGMIKKAAGKYGIDIKESYLIGDSFSDMKCAENAGLKAILVRTGYGERDLSRISEDKINLEYVADDLYSASVYIEQKVRQNSTQVK